MKKILIVSKNESTGFYFQESISGYGFYTARVSEGREMVDFCQVHQPDLILVDVDDCEKIWFSVQAVRTIQNLANLPFLGLSKDGPPETLTKAKEFGFCGLMPKKTDSETLINAIHTIMIEAQQNQEAAAAPEGLVRLKQLSDEVSSVASTLEQRIAEFGDDGPELFGYIRSSSSDIANKLAELTEDDLGDKDLRHDFRNMIGSVTGFSELILMETGLSDPSQSGLARLRECSKEFVELLDQKKAVVH